MQRAQTQPTPGSEENLNCPLCALQVHDGGSGLLCEKCNTWFHPECLYMTEAEYMTLTHSSECWHCDYCKSVLANTISWGAMGSEEVITSEI